MAFRVDAWHLDKRRIVACSFGVSRPVMPDRIAKRRVYLLTGYEPLEPEAHHHRFGREIKRFEKTWGVRATVGPMIRDATGPVARWSAAVSGPGWSTETDMRLLRWDDVIAEDLSLPVWKRLALYLRAAVDMTMSGTFWRYVRTYWRYAFFAAYPAVLLLVFLAVAAGVGALMAGLGGALGVVLGPAAAVVVFLGLLVWPGRKFHIDYMLNDWIFARDMIRETRPSILQRAQAFADEIRAGVAADDVDEVVVVAHSLGAVWMLDGVARALKADPAFGRTGGPVGLIGVGSSTLKIALHPAAGWLREAVQTVADAPQLLWAEYSSHVDFICFYKRNTVETLGLTTVAKPVTRSIRLSRMLSAETWGRFRGNLLRVHRQYVMGNEQRYAYDFHMIACGPFPLKRIVFEGDGLPTWLDADGAIAAHPVSVPEEPAA